MCNLTLCVFNARINNAGVIPDSLLSAPISIWS